MEVFQQSVNSFPSVQEKIWDRYDYKYQVKLACNRIDQIGSPLNEILIALNAGPFLQLLEKLTGEKGLISDPYLVGGGLHQIEPGGSLSVHADFIQPPHLKFYRRLNLLIYLNPDRPEEYGGNLEFWDSKMSQCVKSISPVGNRCVIFTTTASSFHGHPHPLKSPAGVNRKSLAVYYYTLERPKETIGILTHWQKKGEELPQGVRFAGVRRTAASVLWWFSHKFGGLAAKSTPEL